MERERREYERRKEADRRRKSSEREKEGREERLVFGCIRGARCQRYVALPLVRSDSW